MSHCEGVWFHWEHVKTNYDPTNTFLAFIGSMWISLKTTETLLFENGYFANLSVNIAKPVNGNISCSPR